MYGTEFTYSLAWSVPALAIAIILAWLMYKNTSDRLRAPMRWGLTSLRALSLWLILLFLLEPLIRSTEKIKTLPLIVYLHDGSESMMATADSLRLRNQYPTLFNDFVKGLNQDEVDFQPWVFGENISVPYHPDSIRYDRSSTNIAGALRQVNERFTGRHLAAVVLLSDGIYTSGENPVYLLDRIGVPVFTVLAGDTVPGKDAAVGDVMVNSITYVGSEVPVRVIVRTTGYAEADLELKLIHKGKVLDTRKVKTRLNDPEKEMFFSVKTMEAGQQMYEFQLSRLGDEVNYKNNQTRFYLKVLENRMRVSVFSSGPHPDLGALSRALKRFDEYQTELFIRKTPGAFYQTPDDKTLAETDLFILHNFPGTSQDKDWLNRILDQVENRNVPILYFAGNSGDISGNERLFRFLGIAPASISEQTSETLVYTDETYHAHSTWTFDKSWDEWLSHAPPLLRNTSDWQAKSNTRVYGKAIIKGVKLPFPVFGFQEQLGRKNMFFVGENIWRWRAHSYIETNSFDNFDIWLGNCVQWLTTREDKRKFRVYPVKNLFTGNDRVLIQGEVYDDVYQPVSGAEIRLDLRDSEGDEKTFYLNENADRQYGLELFGLKEGTYQYTAELKAKGQSPAKDQGQFSLGKSAAEFLRLTADAALMEQLALRSGAKSVPMENLPQLSETLMQLESLKTIVDYRTTAMDLQRLLWPLLVLIFLLGLEWVIRKWTGLV